MTQRFTNWDNEISHTDHNTSTVSGHTAIIDLSQSLESRKSRWSTQSKKINSPVNPLLELAERAQPTLNLRDRSPPIDETKVVR